MKQKRKIPLAGGTTALDAALCNVEQKTDAIPHHVSFFVRLRDNAARRILSAQKQTTLDSFYKHEIKQARCYLKHHFIFASLYALYFFLFNLSAFL